MYMSNADMQYALTGRTTMRALHICLIPDHQEPMIALESCIALKE